MLDVVLLLTKSVYRCVCISGLLQVGVNTYEMYVSALYPKTGTPYSKIEPPKKKRGITIAFGSR